MKNVHTTQICEENMAESQSHGSVGFSGPVWYRSCQHHRQDYSKRPHDNRRQFQHQGHRETIMWTAVGLISKKPSTRPLTVTSRPRLSSHGPNTDSGSKPIYDDCQGSSNASAGRHRDLTQKIAGGSSRISARNQSIRSTGPVPNTPTERWSGN